MIITRKIKRHRFGLPRGLKFNIETPTPNGNFLGQVSGWVVAPGGVESIEAIVAGKTIAHCLVDLVRPDVCEFLGLDAKSNAPGSLMQSDPVDLPSSFKLEIVAVSRERRARIMTIEGETQSFTQTALQPIVLTSLGRSGSTVVLGHLGSHPEVAVYKPFEAEARYFTYWMQCFFSLSSAKSWTVPLLGKNMMEPSWILGDAVEARPAPTMIYPTLEGWFQQSYVPDLYQFFSAQLSHFYQQVGKLNHAGSEPRFFCEKLPPTEFMDRVDENLVGIKEIVLVRDFRDVLVSVLAFNAKRGFESFGTQGCASDEEYLKTIIAPSAVEMVKRWRKVSDKALLVRYEDFIVDPARELERMFAYLEVHDRDVDAVMQRAKQTAPEMQRAHQTSSDVARSIGRFKTELSPELLELCNEVMREPLQEFGYL